MAMQTETVDSASFSEDEKSLIVTDLLTLRKSQISDFLASVGLPKSGTKEVLRERIEKALSDGSVARPRPAVKSDDVESALRHLDGHQHVFQRLGQVWVLKYDGKMVLMEHARGMMYLARLLLEPQQVVPAASLLASVAGIDPRIATGSSGRLLDDEAFANYRSRYLEL